MDLVGICEFKMEVINVLKFFDMLTVFVETGLMIIRSEEPPRKQRRLNNNSAKAHL